jgi:hypothetical protein
MTSRTFPLSRQRRRRIVKPLVPTQDALSQAGAPDEHPLGDELERSATGDAVQSAGARPAAPRLPHEHDEYADPPMAPQPVIQQAKDDLDAGLEDTDVRNRAVERFGRK